MISRTPSQYYCGLRRQNHQDFWNIHMYIHIYDIFFCHIYATPATRHLRSSDNSQVVFCADNPETALRLKSWQKHLITNRWLWEAKWFPPGENLSWFLWIVFHSILKWLVFHFPCDWVFHWIEYGSFIFSMVLPYFTIILPVAQSSASTGIQKPARES